MVKYNHMAIKINCNNKYYIMGFKQTSTFSCTNAHIEVISSHTYVHILVYAMCIRVAHNRFFVWSFQQIGGPPLPLLPTDCGTASSMWLYSS